MEPGIVQDVRAALAQALNDPANLKGSRLATPAVRAISREIFAQVRKDDKTRTFELCEVLLSSCTWEERTIAFDWAYRCRKLFAETDFARFEGWLRDYVTGWGSCDDFCAHAFGRLIYQYPATLPQAMPWTASPNRWFKRASAVVLIYGIRRDAFFDAAFQTADALLTDNDDMVQKGYGWMLKEVSKRTPMPVFNYVMAHKRTMPRTALRYAIEKLEPSLREQAMRRDWKN
ncbi:MAG: DNA alkylation repair protein [Anaerolineae bacterium]|nr:DNA alkylation repair protein [Anaerolineae bacterium]